MASTKLSRTIGTPTSGTKFTVSAWVKGSVAEGRILTSINGNSSQTWVELQNSGAFRIANYVGSYNMQLITTRLFKDPSAWYHFVVAFDTTQSTDTNRVKLYVNGVQETSFTTTTYPSVNLVLKYGVSGQTFNVGAKDTDTYWNGLMSHVHFVDGAVYTPSTFGETDSTSGIWKPKTSPSISEYGLNGFFLKFENASAMGTDSSGKSNTFAVGGGTPTQTKDTPDNNFTTINPLFPLFTTTLSLGNTKFVTAGASWRSIGATLGMTTGKYYMEFKDLGGTNTGFGISDFTNGGVIDKINRSVSTYAGNNANSYGYHKTGEFFYNGSYTATGYDTYTTNNIIGMAVDMDNLKLYFHKNGTYQNSANPSAGSGGYTIATPVNTYIPTMSVNASTAIVNFGNGYFGTTAVTTNSGAGYAGTDGASIFNYQPPTGYSALSTKGLNT